MRSDRSSGIISRRRGFECLAFGDLGLHLILRKLKNNLFGHIYLFIERALDFIRSNAEH